MAEPATPLRAHEDVALFREAVNFTAAQTRFSARLIEKDYFCSLAVQYLVVRVPGLVFRGGTCLAKIHLGFYRLSEDLDFLVSTPVEASRGERSGRAAELCSGCHRPHWDERLKAVQCCDRVSVIDR